MKEFPSDVVIERILVECKVRAAKVVARGKRIISFDLEWLNKVIDNAAQHGFEMGVVIFRPKGSPKRYVVLEEEAFLDLLTNKGATSHYGT
jgi:hypothetical protein